MRIDERDERAERALRVFKQPTPLQVKAHRDIKKSMQATKLAKQLDTTGHDRRVMLKIKLASLAEEARIIRREEQKRLMGDIRHALWAHRTGDVRFEARAAHLAYGVLRGMPIERMEWNWRKLDPVRTPAIELTQRHDLCQRVLALLRKYGHPKLYGGKVAELPAWLAEGLPGK